MTSVRTTCAYCGVGCGVIASVDKSGAVSIEGDAKHPANYGRLCSKGRALGDTLAPESRLSHPVVDGLQVDWYTAISSTAKRLKDTVHKYGPDAVAFYVSGQLLTEDYYVANKLMKGFIGSANIDTNSRLCMASTVAGHKRAFGADVVPGTYEDLEEADLVVLVGSNLAWCHPVLYQRLRAAKQLRGTKVVVIDPRRTDSCDIADLHIPIMPDGDVLLFNGLLAHLHKEGAAPTAYTHNHVTGYEEAVNTALLDEADLFRAAEERGIATEIKQFFNLFANTERAVTVFSQGVNQAHNGTDRVNAIINCHLATGRIGRSGMGPFSVTGQPNAMGGREVGGLANMLAAHMGFTEADRTLVNNFWQAPSLATTEGLRAVDMFDAIHDGRIKALWIMATNPAVSMPNTHKVREALKRCPTVIVSDCVADTDTQAYAHIRLPAAGWGEKSGTVTNSDRTISRQRAFLPLHADARPDWRIICDVATVMGWGKAFAYSTPSEIFCEHAALSTAQNNNTRAFDIGTHEGISSAEYYDLKPAKWPALKGKKSSDRFFENGDFYTENGKANMLAVRHHAFPAAAKKRALKLNTGRYRDQWHTMTRTGLAPQLNGHRPEPLLEISAADATHHNLTDKGFAKVTTDKGTYTARVHVTDAQHPGEIFLPMHWSETHAASAVAGALIAANPDPISEQPAFKTSWASVEALSLPWRAFIFSKTPIKPEGIDYWTAVRLKNCWQTRVAASAKATFEKSIEQILSSLPGTLVELSDAQAGTQRGSLYENGVPKLAYYAGTSLAGLALEWIDDFFGTSSGAETSPDQLLSGRPKAAQPDKGPIVCSCYQVGLKQISNAIENEQLISVEAIGVSTCAGTGCGSCLPELKNLLKAERKNHAA